MRCSRPSPPDFRCFFRHVALRPGSLKNPAATGILVDDQEPETWARALENLMSDEAGAKRIGRNARRMMEEEWPTWSDVLREGPASLLAACGRAGFPPGGWWA